MNPSRNKAVTPAVPLGDRYDPSEHGRARHGTRCLYRAAPAGDRARSDIAQPHDGADVDERGGLSDGMAELREVVGCPRRGE